MVKKLLAVLACSFALAASMALPAMAASGDGYYVIGSLSNDTTGSISVKVVLESKIEYNSGNSVTSAYDVTVDPMEDGYAGYSVRDAMMSLASNTANHVTLYDVHGNVFESDGDAPNSAVDDTYIKSIKVDGTTYTPQLPFNGFELDGWMFRVNGKIPLISLTGDPASGGPYGQDIASTPISAGDVVHFHWDYQYQETGTTYYSTNFQSFTYTVANGNLNLQLNKSWSYFDNDSWWNIDPFSSSTAEDTYDVAVYTLGSNTPISGIDDEIDVASNGTAQLDISSLSAGTYYLHLTPQSEDVHYKETFDYNEFDDCNILSNTSAFALFTK